MHLQSQNLCDQLLNCASRNCTRALCLGANVIIWIIHRILHHSQIFIIYSAHHNIYSAFNCLLFLLVIDPLSGHHRWSPIPLRSDYLCCLVMHENHTSLGQSMRAINLPLIFTLTPKDLQSNEEQIDKLKKKSIS